MEPDQVEEKSNGALVGLIIIVIILIVGGIYLWKHNVQKNTTPQNQNSSVGTNDTSKLEANANNVDRNNLNNGI